MRTDLIKGYRTRFCALMFLQFGVWGAWYTTIAVYMQQHGMGALTHWAYTVNAVAAVVGPFLVGRIADRTLAVQKLLGAIHFGCGVIMLCVPSAVHDPMMFLALLLVYNLLYMPTLGLANAVVFRHLDNPETQFPLIRVFGTAGWIASGLFISFALPAFGGNTTPEATAAPLYTAGVGSLLLGVYSLTLPGARLSPVGSDPMTTRTAALAPITRFVDRNLLVLMGSILLICIPLAAYYNFTQLYLQAAGFRRIAAVQTLGQLSEVGFMAFMPWLYTRVGTKRILALGMSAWAVRYGLFALGAPDVTTWMIFTGILLHGPCYDFLFVAGQIYLERRFPPQTRARIQGLFVSLTYGLGMLLGAQLVGRIYNVLADGESQLTLAQYRTFWAIPSLLAASVVLIFYSLFSGERMRGDIKPGMSERIGPV